MPVLDVSVPAAFAPERHWTLRVLLERVLGLRMRAVPTHEPLVRIRAGGGAGVLSLQDGLFAGPDRDLRDVRSLPSLPLARWSLAQDVPDAATCDPVLPVLYGRPGPHGGWLSRDAGGTTVHADLLGGAFFLLSRIEEVILPAADAHGRLPAAAGIAARAGILERPLVDEYGAVLHALMRRLWPRLPRPRRTYRLALSHDVDLPFCPGASVRRLGGDLLTRRDPALAVRRAASVLRPSGTGERADVCLTFERIMDAAERHGLRTAFYFMTGGHGRPHGPDYRISEGRTQALMRRIADRGHEIGLHPSYGSWRDPGVVADEFRALRAVADRLGVRQAAWGGRQHYLRWRNPDTWQAWDDAGLSYDSTLTFADAPGFRCGTCTPYPVFNVTTRRPLRLVERPLVVMDGTLLDHQGLAPGAALEAIDRLAGRCRRVGGEFTMLWHNDRLASGAATRLFHASLRAAA